MGHSERLYKMRNDSVSKSPHPHLNDFLIAEGGSCMSSVVNPNLIISKGARLSHAMSRK